MMLDFYDVDPQYLDYLRTIDNKVPQNAYSTHKKFVCGVFVMLNGRSYVVPVSSSRGGGTEFKIKSTDKVGKEKTIASLKFYYMFPVPKEHISRRLISKETDTKYQILMRNEWNYINSKEQDIRKRAEKVYADATKPNSAIKKFTCDFAKLEREATAEGFNKFLADHQQSGQASNNGASAASDPSDQSAQQPNGNANDAQGVDEQAPSQDAASQSAVSSQLLSMVSNIPAAQSSGNNAQNQATSKKEDINE